MAEQRNLFEYQKTNNNENILSKVISSKTIEDFKKQLRESNCHRCSLAQDYVQKPTTSRGNTSAKIILVGEAPGYNEMEQGKPFVGRAGKLLDEMLLEFNLKTEELMYVSNICRCRPKDNRTPRVKEANTCISYLNREIELLKPKIIVCLGATPSKYLLKGIVKISSMKELVGKFIDGKEKYKDILFYVIYHPAALLYNNKLRPDMQGLLYKLKEKMKELKLIK